MFITVQNGVYTVTAANQYVQEVINIKKKAKSNEGWNIGTIYFMQFSKILAMQYCTHKLVEMSNFLFFLIEHALLFALNSKATSFRWIGSKSSRLKFKAQYNSNHFLTQAVFSYLLEPTYSTQASLDSSPTFWIVVSGKLSRADDFKKYTYLLNC